MKFKINHQIFVNSIFCTSLPLLSIICPFSYLYLSIFGCNCPCAICLYCHAKVYSICNLEKMSRFQILIDNNFQHYVFTHIQIYIVNFLLKTVFSTISDLYQFIINGPNLKLKSWNHLTPVFNLNPGFRPGWFSFIKL